MKRERRRWFIWMAALTLALTAGAAGAKESAKKEKVPAAESDGAGASGGVNACGCYKKGNTCVCAKKGKCACPGECEPVGCEEKRAKEMEKEMAAAVKAAQDDEKKRAEEEKKKAAEEEKKRQAAEAAEQGGSKEGGGKESGKESGEESTEAPAEKPAKPSKAARKSK